MGTVYSDPPSSATKEKHYFHRRSHGSENNSIDYFDFLAFQQFSIPCSSITKFTIVQISKTTSPVDIFIFSVVQNVEVPERDLWESG